MTTDNSRRNFLLSTIFGAGAVGLRALATGLPIGFLTRSRNAAAETDCTTVTDAQNLILVTSGSGDPLNANVPGTYDSPDVYHSPRPEMAATALTLGGASYQAAKVWTDLDPAIKGRISFLHHGTYTNAHGDHLKVNRLMNAVNRQETMVSMFARELTKCIGTVQAEPVVISNNLVTAKGRTLPVLTPTVLKQVLSAPTGPLLALQQQRDQTLDRLNALTKQSGRKADADILDRYALSQTQVRSLEQSLLADLASISGTTRQDLNIAAAVLLRLKVSPVVVMSYSFGGDNHGDTDLAGEASSHTASIAGLNDLYTRLSNATYGLWDHTTIALQNVFGRTLNIKSHSNEPNGRNHNANHHCSVFIGKHIKPSVIGGIMPNAANTDFRARSFDAATGAANESGDVPYEQTLGAVGKTLGAALGLPASTLDTEITKGKVIGAALT